jgi:ribosomal protein S12 methylthiotransferase accessory factor YcaO
MKGCHLFLWSSCGADYCRKTAQLHALTELFERFTAKPDIVIDDMPYTYVSPFTYRVQQEGGWQTLAEQIIEKHVD